MTGNRTQVAYGGSTYASTISATSNRLLNVAGPLPARSNLFDGAGNVTSDGSIGYTYSDRGRLQRVVKQGVATEYLYNARGVRVSKSGANVAGGAKYSVYSEGGELLGEYGADGRAIQETVYLDGIPIGVIASSSTEPFYVYSDHINTPRVITRSSDNAIVWRWDTADPFGNAPALESPNGELAFVYNPRFPGQVFDSETNNHYNYFRDYDPQTGRYIQSDPIGLEGESLSTYAYVDNDPVGYVDPEGLTKFRMGVKPPGMKPPRWSPNRAGQGKPDYRANPAHDPNSPKFNPNKTPEPKDCQDVYGKAIPDDPYNPRHWWGRNANGDFYRYHNTNDGTVHYSGTFEARASAVPPYVRSRMGY